MFCNLAFYHSHSSTCKTLCVIKGGKDGFRGGGGHLPTQVYSIFVLKEHREKIENTGNFILTWSVATLIWQTFFYESVNVLIVRMAV